ncbi:MAG: hypothetical protein KDI13_05585 [Alphaproteobacteria bacterium]|nr:hypothetical protein [Alphaproteobacteria bacterium]
MLKDHVLNFISEREEIANAIRQRAVFADTEQAIHFYTRGRPERNVAVALFYLGFYDPRGSEAHNDAIDVLMQYIDILIDYSTGISSDPDDLECYLSSRGVEEELDYIRDFLSIRPASLAYVNAYIDMKKTVHEAEVRVEHRLPPPGL